MKTLSEDKAWLDGWYTAGDASSRYDRPSYQTGLEQEAFVAGWNARMEHIALGYQHDVPLPPSNKD